ncbi:MAG: HAD family hydrolase [Acidimicrobiia bacterium]|nr:HAD family hydrolase [Acidimicrobiia bacterium]
MSVPVWVFDVDGCLVDSLTGTSLRPGAVELLAHLRRRGARVLLWSAGGATYARRRAEEQGVARFFHGFHDKDVRDEAGRYVTHGFLEDHAYAVFVDDRPEDMPVGAEVVAVPPYLAGNPHDRGLRHVARRAGLHP